MIFRKLTRKEYMYLWYIEYGEPYHYICTPQEISSVIKTLIADEICVQLHNPTLDKSPLYTRFTRQGRMLFLSHQALLGFRHPTELGGGILHPDDIEESYNIYVDGYEYKAVLRQFGLV